MVSKKELQDAFEGINPATGKELPVKLIQIVVEQIKTFLLGDGFQKKIKFLAINSEQQETLTSKLDEINLYKLLNDAYIDAIVFGETFVDTSEGKLRHIKTKNVVRVEVDPEDPLKVVYLKERREIYDPSNNNYKFINVEHYLSLPETSTEDGLDILSLPSYKYLLKVEGQEPLVLGDHLPIVRLVNQLDGREATSAIERIVHLQLEYNELRARINLNGKHHKPILYTIGTSAPKYIGRTDRESPSAIDSATGSTAFQTAFTSDSATVLHFPISNTASEAGIEPKIGYIQPLDSPYLERQRLLILQDIYTLSSVMVLELQNARSASSSSSLSVLYEPLKRSTFNRANYLISAINLIFAELGISIPFRIELPDLMPKDLQDKRLQQEAVKNKLISRKRYLIEVEGLTEQEADKELEQLDAEKGLNIQYSAALVDSKDAPNLDEGNLFTDKAIDNPGTESISPTEVLNNQAQS